ncbi:MAG: response regulator [Sphingosinicella sp.]|nr:response regulator [Sphingosinicella sp.]
MLHAPLEADAEQGGGDRKQVHFVYVVDDQAALRQSSCFLLQALGIACTQFANGREFLAEIGHLTPGCVLLDVKMEAMDGLEVQTELKRRGFDWPIIFMSGQRDVPAVVQAVKNGAVQFLDKPFSEEQLLAALHSGFVLLRGEGGAPEAAAATA